MTGRYGCWSDHALVPPWPGATTVCHYAREFPGDPKCAGCFREREQEREQDAAEDQRLAEAVAATAKAWGCLHGR